MDGGQSQVPLALRDGWANTENTMALCVRNLVIVAIVIVPVSNHAGGYLLRMIIMRISSRSARSIQQTESQTAEGSPWVFGVVYTAGGARGG